MSFIDDLGWDDLLSIPTMGGYSAAKGAYNAATGGNLPDDVGGAFKDFSKVGSNQFAAQPYTPAEVNWGGYQGAAGDVADQGFAGMAGTHKDANWFQGQMKNDRGPQANENAQLSDREAESRYGDQSGAIQLAREAAMGQSPSEAAYLQQQGLNQAVAGQASAAGSARGNAAIALAQGNAAGNTAGLQNQAYTSGSALRAKEMADARGQYGGLSGQQRDQDLQRLGMGNQMGQFNANLNDQYKLGMGQLGNAAGNQELGWYQAAQNPYNQQAQSDLERQKIAADSYNQTQAVNAGVSQANADQRAQSKKDWISVASTLAGAAGGMGGSAIGGK